MAYSVMVWLVNPGVHPQQEEEQVIVVRNQFTRGLARFAMRSRQGGTLAR